MIMHRPEGDIVVEAGEAHYVGPGHTGEVRLPGTEVIECSPADEDYQTMAIVARNLAAAGASNEPDSALASADGSCYACCSEMFGRRRSSHPDSSDPRR